MDIVAIANNPHIKQSERLEIEGTSLGIMIN